ncbi:hypothetical protein HPP92_021257 [Vanilla planifolia]|uniref:Alpha-mannosidase n=1 Tax=Vanilla planifolia TaxID=51239 RepID=A0A835Q256_VANPL|nr:hypothetical protein HPP92_021257 [Vanilla planifolia]
MGYAETEKVVSLSLGCLAGQFSNSTCYNPAMNFEQCPLLNISYCPPSEIEFSHGRSLVVLVYNSLGWKRDDVIRIPVVSNSVIVEDSSSSKKIECQLLPITDAAMNLRSHYVKAYYGISPRDTPKFWLIFPVSVPPLGFSTYVISTASERGSAAVIPASYSSIGNSKGYVEIGPGNLKLLYNVDKRELSYYSNRRKNVKTSLSQSFKYYIGAVGNQSDLQASGAYIFRPNGTIPIKLEAQVSLTIFQGPLVDEVHQQVNPWIYQVTRLYKAKEHVEFEFMQDIFTDSNGRDFIKRIRDYRSDWKLEVHQPVAGNYYPVNLGIYLEDKRTELSLLVDRCLGGSSIKDGQVELMLHRRLLHDDGKGVDEALNETVCINDECAGLTIQGKVYLRIDPLGEGAKWRRTTGQEIYSPLLLAFSEQDGGNWASSHLANFSLTESYNLPDNVAMITLQTREDGSVLLRLAHLYEIGEDKDLSKLSSVDLKKLFPRKKITKITETNLSANQERTEMEKKRLKWKVDDSSRPEMVVRGRPVDPSRLLVELGPMEIRTFILNFG